MKRLPSEANGGRATDRVKEGYGNAGSRGRGDMGWRSPNWHGASATRANLRADGQEPHKRPIRHDELAQHSEVVRCARGGRCGGSAAEQRALTWGMGAKRTWTAWLISNPAVKSGGSDPARSQQRS
jgi:hypothetical protein